MWIGSLRGSVRICLLLLRFFCRSAPKKDPVVSRYWKVRLLGRGLIILRKLKGLIMMKVGMKIIFWKRFEFRKICCFWVINCPSRIIRRLMLIIKVRLIVKILVIVILGVFKIIIEVLIRRKKKINWKINCRRWRLIIIWRKRRNLKKKKKEF